MGNINRYDLFLMVGMLYALYREKGSHPTTHIKEATFVADLLEKQSSEHHFHKSHEVVK